MELHTLDPLTDPRWGELIARHPGASAFHEPGWLEALKRTYGYQPFVLTSTPDGAPLVDGLVLCRVSSWITGTRVVSLPFTDYCEPLLSNAGQLPEFLAWLRAECDRHRWRYFELRPLSAVQDGCGLVPGRSYGFHTLDLRPNLEQIFQGLHKDSIQRRIQRAEREGLVHESGRSPSMVDEFYRLLLLTRKRHHVLPQPRAWFTNLIAAMGDKIQIRVARKQGVAIAAMLTLRHRCTVVYKYGGSDARLHHLAGMPLLFWKLIEESKACGTEQIDFGRSDLENQGLMTFKDRFGTKRKLLTYLRYPQKAENENPAQWPSRVMRPILSLLPDVVLPAAGGIVYRHMG